MYFAMVLSLRWPLGRVQERVVLGAELLRSELCSEVATQEAGCAEAVAHDAMLTRELDDVLRKEPVLSRTSTLLPNSATAIYSDLLRNSLQCSCE
jgi:hypothetical protein